MAAARADRFDVLENPRGRSHEDRELRIIASAIAKLPLDILTPALGSPACEERARVALAIGDGDDIVQGCGALIDDTDRDRANPAGCHVTDLPDAVVTPALRTG